MKYRLTFVLSNGISQTTEASGYAAESLLDQEFDRICKDLRTVFAIVSDGGSIRRHYAATEWS